MKVLTAGAVIRAAPELSFVRVERLPGSAAAARKAASRAAKEGELVSVRRGLYYRGRRSRYGMTLPRAEDVAREVLGTLGIGPAGYSAARAWGVTTQVPAKWHVSTLKPADPIDGVEQHARRNLLRANLNEREIALLELLRAPDVYVESGWSELERRVRDAARAEEIDYNRLAAAVEGERNLAVRTNFRRLRADVPAWTA